MSNRYFGKVAGVVLGAYLAASTLTGCVGVRHEVRMDEALRNGQQNIEYVESRKKKVAENPNAANPKLKDVYAELKKGAKEGKYTLPSGLRSIDVYGPEGESTRFPSDNELKVYGLPTRGEEANKRLTGKFMEVAKYLEKTPVIGKTSTDIVVIPVLRYHSSDYDSTPEETQCTLYGQKRSLDEKMNEKITEVIVINPECGEPLVFTEKHEDFLKYLDAWKLALKAGAQVGIATGSFELGGGIAAIYAVKGTVATLANDALNTSNIGEMEVSLYPGVKISSENGYEAASNLFETYRYASEQLPLAKGMQLRNGTIRILNYTDGNGNPAEIIVGLDERFTNVYREEGTNNIVASTEKIGENWGLKTLIEISTDSAGAGALHPVYEKYRKDKLKGDPGKDGEDGAQGLPGQQGPPGEEGKDGLSCTTYTETEGNEQCIVVECEDGSSSRVCTTEGTVSANPPEGGIPGEGGTGTQ